MEEHLIKVVVTAGVVTGTDETGAVIDAVVGQHIMVREQVLESLKNRVKRVDAPLAPMPKK